MPSKLVTVAVISGRMSPPPCPDAPRGETNSGNSTALSVVWKNFSTMSLPAPLTWMSKRLS